MRAWGAGTWVVFALPPVALGIWGWIYAASCAEALGGDLTGVRFSYRGLNGPVLGYARRARFDFAKGRLVAEGVTLRSGDTKQTIGFASVVAPLPWVHTPAYLVTGGDADLWIERGRRGDWSVDSFLPYTKERAPSGAVYDIALSNSRVRFTDRYGTRTSEWAISADSFTVSGSGDEATLRFSGVIQGIGSLSAGLDFSAGRLAFVEVSSKDLNLVPVRQYLAGWPDFKGQQWLDGWSAREASFSGRARAWLRADKWFVDGSGRASAVDIRIGDQGASVAAFEGTFNQDAVAGKFSASDRELIAEAQGAIQYSGHGVLTGSVRGDSERSLRGFGSGMPADLRFQAARFDGSVAFGEKLELSGELNAKSVSFKEFTGSRVAGRVAGDGDSLRFSNITAAASGGKISAELGLKYGKTPSLAGFATASGIDLADTPYLPNQVRTGTGELTVLLSGTPQRPTGVIRASGHAVLALEGGGVSKLERVDFGIAGTLDGKGLHLDAGEVASEDGVVRGSGSLGWDGSALSLNLAASGVTVGALPGSQATGIGYGDFLVRGTTRRPVVSGFVEVYSGAIGDYSLPFASGRVELAGSTLRLANLVGRSGVSIFTGNALIDLDHGTLTGSGFGEDIGLGHWTGGIVQGLGNGTWSVSGTTEKPTVDVTATADEVVLGQVEFQNTRVSGNWSEGAFHIRDAVSNVGGGRLTVFGGWSLAGSSSLTATLENVSAKALQPYLREAATLNGQLGGDANLSFADGVASAGNLSLVARGISVNGEAIGSGSFDAKLADKRVSLSGAIGSLDSYFILEDAGYGLEDSEFHGTVSTLDASINQAGRLFANIFQDSLTSDQADGLHNVDGKYTVRATLSGTAKGDEVSVRTADVSGSFESLTHVARPMGSGAIAFKKDGDLYTIENAAWVGGPVSMRLSKSKPNTIVDGGAIQLDGEFYNIDASWLRNLDPAYGDLYGILDASFRVSGESKSPVIQADLNATGLRYGDFAAEILSVGPVFIRDGSITGAPDKGPDEAIGRLQVRGFEARLLDLDLPFAYPFEFPTDRALSARVYVPPRDIADLSRFFGGLDLDATSGTLQGGTLAISGTYDKLDTRGSIVAEAKRLKFSAFDTPLSDVTASAGLEGSVLRIQTRGKSQLGGGYDFLAALDLGTQTFAPGSHLALDGLSVTQGFGKGNVARGKLDASIDISGGFTNPQVTGSATGDAAALKLLGDLPASTAGTKLPFDPAFNIALSLKSGTVTTSAIEAQTTGSGRLQGLLSGLDVQMGFVVDAGGMNLPTGRVRLEKGGSATFSYMTDWRGVPEASLAVDLNASTRVTANGGFGLQRYRIDMHITGNLLGAEELQIDATSTPPDLSKSQILAILGQQGAFEAVGAASGDFGAQVKALLSSLVAPTILGKLTESIEKTFGLDYLSLDFSPAGVGGITVAKALGNGFTLEYRRVIEQFAVVGESLEEIRLNYVLPSRNPLLGRLALGIAADRLGQLKLSFGYTKRF